MVVSYTGAAFCGFQRQPTADTVQARLEEHLQRICNEAIHVTPAGRTDAGVHAAAQVVHFDTISRIPCLNLKKALNSQLPEHIRITQVFNVTPEFHARHSAYQREYIYTFACSAPVPIYLKDYVWDLFPAKLDVRAFRRAMKLLRGTHDFTGFCVSSDKNENKERTVYRVELRKSSMPEWPGSSKRSATELWSFRIVASGFLQRMVRLIVGSLIEVARGKKTLAELHAMLDGKKSKLTRLAAPAHGLCLLKVHY